MTPQSAALAVVWVVIAVGFMALTGEMWRLERYVRAGIFMAAVWVCLGVAASQLVAA